MNNEELELQFKTVSGKDFVYQGDTSNILKDARMALYVECHGDIKPEESSETMISVGEITCST